MNPRVFLDVDPRTLRVRYADQSGADPYKLQVQIARFKDSMVGMPPIVVYRGSDGELLLYDGLTRASRIAKLRPGTLVHVEVIEDKRRSYGNFPLLEDTLS